MGLGWWWRRRRGCWHRGRQRNELQAAGCLNHKIVLGGVGGNIKCWLGYNQAAVVFIRFKRDGVEQGRSGCYSPNVGLDDHSVFTFATRARQGNTAAMGADVPLQVGVHDKLLRAVWTFEVFSCGVRAEVKLKIGRVREALGAMRALKGSFSRMGAFMLLAQNSQTRQNKNRFSPITHTKKTQHRDSAEALLTCLRLDVWEKDFEQMEQT